MQKVDERLVLFFDLAVSATGYGGRNGSITGITPPSMLDILKMLIDLHALETIARKNHADTDTTYLVDADLNLTDQVATLLINLSDRRASDVVLSNPATKTRRLLKKRVGEGADYSSHMVIRLKPLKASVYRVLLEVSPGLSSARLEHLFNMSLRACRRAFPIKFERPHPDGSLNKDGTPKTVSLLVKVHLRGYPSKQFIQDLEKGFVQSVELVNTVEKNTMWDQNGYVVEQERKIILRPEKEKMRGRVMDTLKGIGKRPAGNSYDLLRVKFITDTDLPRTVTLEKDTLNLVNDLSYVKKQVIKNFPNPLPSSFSEISPDIQGRMVVLLK